MPKRRSDKRRIPVEVEESQPQALPESEEQTEEALEFQAPETGQAAETEAGEDAAAAADGELQAELAQLRQQLQEAESNYLYAVADLQNARRRHQRELVERQQYANEQLIRALLPVLDDLRRGLAAADDVAATAAADLEAIKQGVRIIVSRLENVLSQFGVAAIAPEAGDHFDPHRHEVAERVEDDEQEEGTILEVLTLGYELHGRVLRPARVKAAAKVGGEGD